VIGTSAAGVAGLVEAANRGRDLADPRLLDDHAEVGATHLEVAPLTIDAGAPVDDPIPAREHGVGQVA